MLNIGFPVLRSHLLQHEIKDAGKYRAEKDGRLQFRKAGILEIEVGKLEQIQHDDCPQHPIDMKACQNVDAERCHKQHDRKGAQPGANLIIGKAMVDECSVAVPKDADRCLKNDADPRRLLCSHVEVRDQQ